MLMTQLFGTRLPIVQAPMAGVQDGDLAVAVCKAGGLGSLPCAMLTPQTVLDECAKIRAATDQPFNLNFFCHRPPHMDAERLAAWKARFHHHYAHWGIDPDGVGPGAIRVPFGEEMLAVVKQVKPAVVSFHFGLPAADLVEQVRATGAKIMSSATTVDEALWLQSKGVDAIIAQGVEAGGHRGMFLNTGPVYDITTQVGTFALLPQVLQAVTVPVIAAGGIADTVGVQAALAMGAAGVQVGTSFLLCTEAKTSAVHRAALQGEGARHTALTNVFTGRPARGIVNQMMKELSYMNADAPEFPSATAASAPLRAKAEAAGSGDFTPLWAGQNTSGCAAISATDMTRRLMGLR